MPPKGSTYWTANRVFKYGTSATSILAISLFGILAALGHINVTGISHTENCAGSPSDLCYLYLNFTPARDIYVQANEMWLETSPPIKSLKLQRTWGPSWRTIDLTKTWSSRVKYAVLFHKDTDYRVRFIAEKYDPRDVIEWDINPTGVWGAAKPKIKCDEITVPKETHFKKITNYIEHNDTYWDEYVFDYVETKEVCIPGTERIEYAEDIMPVKDGGKCCWIHNDTVKCDGVDHDPDNGNCIENSGDTIETYEFTDMIQFKEKKNGKVKIV